jgi:hypothetical protein
MGPDASADNVQQPKSPDGVILSCEVFAILASDPKNVTFLNFGYVPIAYSPNLWRSSQVGKKNCDVFYERRVLPHVLTLYVLVVLETTKLIMSFNSLVHVYVLMILTYTYWWRWRWWSYFSTRWQGFLFLHPHKLMTMKNYTSKNWLTLNTKIILAHARQLPFRLLTNKNSFDYNCYVFRYVKTVNNV